MIVVDASVLAAALLDDGRSGERARERLRAQDLAAPELIHLEVTSVARRLLASGVVDERRAMLAMEDLSAAPIEVAPHRALLHRVWELRDNLTPYDAAYVALAEALEAVLVTADARLSRAPGVRCTVEVLG